MHSFVDLKRELVLRFNKEHIYNKQSKEWLNVVTKKKYDRKPIPYTDHLSRNLKLLVENGFLEIKPGKHGKGRPTSKYRPTKKRMLIPLKLHYDSLIKDTSMEYIYPGLEYMLLLPENLTVKEFLEKGRTVLFEEAFNRFFCSVSLILLDARLEKAKDVWTTKINSNENIYPPLKLRLWIEMLIFQIIKLSPVLRRAYIYDRDLDLKEKTHKSIQSLSQLIFRDICYALSYYPKDKKKRKAKIKKMNDRIQTSFKVNAEYINNVWNEIYGIIEEKEFGVVISPAAFLKPSPDFSDGFGWLLEEKEKHGTVKVQKIGKKRVIHKITMKEKAAKMAPCLADFQVREAEEIGIETGKYWFNNNFSKDTQEELRKLYIDLGYSENTFYMVLGLFIFPLPILVMPTWGEKK